MLNFTNDLNLLAANNVIGYDTYAQTMNAVGGQRGRYNHFGVGKLNTGVTQDTFSGSTAKKAATYGVCAAGGFALGSRIIKAVKKAATGNASSTTAETATKVAKKAKTKKSFIESTIQSIKKSLGMKTTAKATRTSRAAAQAATKTGAKGVLSKIAKGGKIAVMLAGIGVIAKGALNVYQNIKYRQELVGVNQNSNNQPQS